MSGTMMVMRAGGVGGGHAVIGILDRDANFRLQAEARRRQKIEIGARLAARDVVAGQDGLETVADAGKLSDARPPCARRGGDDRHRTFGRLQRIQQFDRAAFQRQAWRARISSRSCVTKALLISAKRKAFAIARVQHGLAFRTGKADHRAGTASSTSSV